VLDSDRVLKENRPYRGIEPQPETDQREIMELRKVAVRSMAGMTRWFSPALLLDAGSRHLITQIFGERADQRVIQAASDPERNLESVIARYDYRGHEWYRDAEAGGAPVWIDYVADTGDGFDSTYAVASLVAARELAVKGASEPLPGGKILVMGGDQVYPYPTREAYHDRLEVPYKLALPNPAEPRHIYAIPGNHDWYDGLASFDSIFCHHRHGFQEGYRTGGWNLPQHRSYFALRLPHNWWIFGADIQLSRYLDSAQVNYFRAITERMTSEDKIILCNAAPSWVYPDSGFDEPEMNLLKLADVVHQSKAQIVAILAGDLHHYSRYSSAEVPVQLITAGGGGAYMHPTHDLRSTITMPWPADKGHESKVREFHLDPAKGAGSQGVDRGPAVYPGRVRSRWMVWSNLLFPFRNPMFCLTLGILYWLMTWQFSSTHLEIARTQEVMRGNTVVGTLTSSVPTAIRCILFDEPTQKQIVNPDYRFSAWFTGDHRENIRKLFRITPQTGAYNPLLGFWVLGVILAAVYYADCANWRRKIMVGVSHALLHFAAMIFVYVFTSWLTQQVFPGYTQGCLRDGAEVRDATGYNLDAWGYTGIRIFQIVLLGWLIAGLIWGIYLAISTSLFCMHCDNAYSALRIPGYKNFLRLKLEPDKLTVYPVGLDKVPRRRSWRPSKSSDLSASALDPAKPLKPKLIEGPIVIKPRPARIET
jgi:hypothetical protein